MKYIILLFITLFSYLSLFAQQNEIDRLCAKYKQDSTYIIYATDDEIRVTVYISQNPDGKPESISLSGKVSHISGIAETITNLVNQKKRQGYVFDELITDMMSQSGSNISFSKSQIIDASYFSPIIDDHFKITMKKGSMYFIAKINCYSEVKTWDGFMKQYETKTTKGSSKGQMANMRASNKRELIPSTYAYIYYSFDLTNGDNSRKGGKKAKNFDF
jgi:hypothetical protein